MNGSLFQYPAVLLNITLPDITVCPSSLPKQYDVLDDCPLLDDVAVVYADAECNHTIPACGEKLVDPLLVNGDRLVFMWFSEQPP